MDSIGMRPVRGLGQNFLLDGNLLDCIVRLSAPQKGERILEIGPGFGALTTRLLDAGADVYAVEFDHRIADYLRAHIKNEHLHLTEADACKTDYLTMFGDRPFRAIANLPYSISTVFIAKMLDLQNPPESMFFMLQRETGERLSAFPGSKQYSALSVRIQLRYNVKLEKIVPPSVFFPMPEVDSALVSFRKYDRYDGDPELFRHLPGVVKTLFAQRRKQVGKVLRQTYGQEKAIRALAEARLPPEIRPDRISVDEFVFLTRALFAPSCQT